MLLGHRPNTDAAVLELHRLLSGFLASRNFASLRTPRPDREFDPIFHIQKVEEDEISRLLLNLAIVARVIDDRNNSALNKVGSNCGQLVKDIATKSEITLSLREACNKIIHAEQISFDRDTVDGKSYLRPTIYLTGKRNDKEWSATLNVIDFAKDYFALVCYL